MGLSVIILEKCASKEIRSSHRSTADQGQEKEEDHPNRVGREELTLHPLLSLNLTDSSRHK